MHKEIKVVDYLKEIGMTFQGFPMKVIESNAFVFFNIFGVEIVEEIINAEEGKVDATEEVYQCLYVLYKEMGKEPAEFFIKTLKKAYEIRKKAKLQEEEVS